MIFKYRKAKKPITYQQTPFDDKTIYFLRIDYSPNCYRIGNTCVSVFYFETWK